MGFLGPELTSLETWNLLIVLLRKVLKFILLFSEQVLKLKSDQLSNQIPNV